MITKEVQYFYLYTMLFDIVLLIQYYLVLLLKYLMVLVNYSGFTQLVLGFSWVHAQTIGCRFVWNVSTWISKLSLKRKILRYIFI